MNGLPDFFEQLAQLILTLGLSNLAPEEVLLGLFCQDVNNLSALSSGESLSELSVPTEFVSQNLLHHSQPLL